MSNDPIIKEWDAEYGELLATHSLHTNFRVPGKILLIYFLLGGGVLCITLGIGWWLDNLANLIIGFSIGFFLWLLAGLVLGEFFDIPVYATFQIFERGIHLHHRSTWQFIPWEQVKNIQSAERYFNPRHKMYLLVITRHHAKAVEVRAIQEQNGQALVKAIEPIWRQYTSSEKAKDHPV